MSSDVKHKLNEEMWNFKGSNLCLMETSHRSPVFAAVNNATNDELRAYLAVPPNYKILLMQGGVELAWSAIAYNLFFNSENAEMQKAIYITTGPQSIKAANEAKKIAGDERVSEATLAGFPAEKAIDYIYSYFCMNDLESCQYTSQLEADSIANKVVDCSSVLGFLPIDISKYAVVFGSAEHSLGITGCTIVVVREDLIKANPKIPSMFSFEVMLRTSSIFNTPNCFAVYVLGENVRYFKSAYGTPEQVKTRLQCLHDKLAEELQKRSSPFQMVKSSSDSIKTVKLRYLGTDASHIHKVSTLLESSKIINDFAGGCIISLQPINTQEEIISLVAALSCQQAP